MSKIIQFGKYCWTEYKAKSHHDYCAAVFRERLERNNIPADKPALGEEDYIRFWKQFHKRIEPYTYRLFSTLCDNNPHIVPEDIAYRYIEPILNPLPYRAFYSDKNMYHRFLTPCSIIPKTYLYRILNGLVYSSGHLSDDLPVSFDADAETIASVIDPGIQKVVLKPSVNSGSGRDVRLLERNEGVFTDSCGNIMSGQYLKDFGSDWVLQEALIPHPYLQQFSRTSVNTMRIMTYRSVVDDTVTVFGGVLRIGSNGSFVDNLFAGGGFVTINVITGELGRQVYNRYWQSSSVFNGVDFSLKLFVLPFWQEAASFAKNVAKQVSHARLLAQDIIIDSDGNPRLIEFNVSDFDWGLTMTAGKIPFGDRFDEVIDHCLNQHV